MLIVDCDLRRPAQHRHFSETSHHQGVTDVLTNKLKVEEAIQQTPVPNLSMLTSGPIPTDVNARSASAVSPVSCPRQAAVFHAPSSP